MRDRILASAAAQPAASRPPGRADQDFGRTADRERAAPGADPGPGRTRPRERRTLTPADWTGAALDALARDGLRAVAVEPLAERLGATKGSFYWHFRDRNALLEAAVAQWEHTATDELIGRLEAIPDAGSRQRATLDWVADSDHDMKIFMVLLWNADHPVIGPVINRILTKRMAFSLRMREQYGEDAAQAHRSMMYAYSVLLGLQLLRRAAPELVPEGGTPQDLRDYVASLIRQATGLDLPAAA
ncbi:MAG: TetR/AcrR family transcriptional regulator [Actinocrinis sp.]